MAGIMYADLLAITVVYVRCIVIGHTGVICMLNVDHQCIECNLFSDTGGHADSNVQGLLLFGFTLISLPKSSFVCMHIF